MQWVLNFCRTLKIPTLESWQKFKIIFLKNFSPVKSWSYGRLGWKNPKRSGILLFPDLPLFGGIMKTRTRSHSQSSWMIDFPDTFEICEMVGGHSQHMKTQAYSVNDVGYRMASVRVFPDISAGRWSLADRETAESLIVWDSQVILQSDLSFNLLLLFWYCLTSYEKNIYTSFSLSP